MYGVTDGLQRQDAEIAEGAKVAEGRGRQRPNREIRETREKKTGKLMAGRWSGRDSRKAARKGTKQAGEIPGVENWPEVEPGRLTLEFRPE